MDQAVHLIVLALLGVAIFYAGVMVLMTGFTLSRRAKAQAYGLLGALIVAAVLVLYNPGFIPGVLRAIPLPPSPFTVS